MKTLTTSILSLILVTGLYAHGGQYRGPRDIVPPGGGGNPGGPVTPGQPGQPGGPTTPPGTPTTPGTGPISPPGSTTPGFNPTTGPGIQLTVSDEDWTFWWEFNKDRYLNIKRHIHKNTPTTAEEDFDLDILGKKNAKITIDKNIVKTKIFPILIQVLEDPTRSPDEYSSALVALGKIGYEDINVDLSIKAITNFLSNKNQEVAETAALSLGILGLGKSLDILTNIALDTPEGKRLTQSTQVPIRTRAFAAYGIGIIASKSIQKVKDDATNVLLTLLHSDHTASNDCKVAAIQGLSIVSSLSDDIYVSLTEQIKREKNDVIKAHAYTAYARMLRSISNLSTASNYVELMLTEILDKTEGIYTRLSKIQLLGITPTLQVITELKFKILKKAYLNSKTAQEKYFALISMGQLRTTEALIELQQILIKDQKQYKPWAALAIGICLYENNVNEKNYNESISILEELIANDAAAERKGAYVIALGLMKADMSAQLVTRDMLESNIQQYVGYCALSLGLMNSKVYSNTLLDKLKTSKRYPEQLQNVAIGTVLTDNKDALATLVEMLKTANVTSVYASIANALGFIGDARAIEPLVKMTMDTKLSSEARAFAIVALGIIGDRSEFNWNVPYSENCNYRANTSTFTGSGKGILDIL